MLTPGNVNDITVARELLLPFRLGGKTILADKGYDSGQFATPIVVEPLLSPAAGQTSTPEKPIGMLTKSVIWSKKCSSNSRTTADLLLAMRSLRLLFVPSFILLLASFGYFDGFKTHSKALKGAAGGVAELDGSGKVPETQLPAFDPDGSAASVQTNLNAHTNNKSNPHNVTAAQVGAFTKDQSLSAAVAALYGKGASATPNDIFAVIKPLIDGKCKVETGSYVGTGTYGAANPKSITFSGAPKLVLINNFNNEWYYLFNASALTTDFNQNGYINNQSYQSRFAKLVNKTLSWYDNEAIAQANIASVAYNYVAITV